MLSLLGSSFLVVGTLRSDFLCAFQTHKELQDLLYEPFHLRQMGLADFAQVIEGPARIAGLELDAGLAQTIVAEAATDDALPLIAFILRELWNRSSYYGRLTLKDYEQLGGLQGSVARDQTLDVGRERQLRKAFLSRVRVDEKGRYARKPAVWKQLPEDVHGLLERFVQARLLVSHGDGAEKILEVVHETLFYSWDRLGRWLEADRAFLLWRQHLKTRIDEWQGSQYDKSALLRGPALAEAEYKISERLDDLSISERRFVQTSSALRHQTRRRNINLL